MTDSSPKPASTKAKTAHNGPAHGHGGIAWLALLLALATAGASGYLWYRLTVVDGLLGGDLPGRTDAVEKRQGQLAATQEELTAADASLTARQANLEQSISQLSTELGKQRRDWTLEETAQLLIVANSRVALARDIPTAIRALAEADQRLDSLTDPALFKVREQIAADISALQLVPRPDIEGMALRLDNMTRAIGKLPLATRPHFVKAAAAGTADDDRTAWRRLLDDAWADLKTLIKVRRIESDRPPLLPQEQSYFLRENLRLMLGSAQVAMLRNNDTVFKANLRQSQEWLGEYFDNDAEPVQELLAELEKMQGVDLRPELPDISGSLQALRNYQKRRGSEGK